MSEDNKWEMGTDQEAILENERLSFLDELPEGMSLQDYSEINEAVRKDEGMSKEEWYCHEMNPDYGLEPRKMLYTPFSPDSPGWHGKICIVLHCYHNMITYLVKDSENLPREMYAPFGNMHFGSNKKWRIYNNYNLEEGEIYAKHS
tara:strand:- start:42 stop:479 length:438 start_codon:yes stop_codon:yes gene_type:complete